jgi:hypothetical protein
VNANLTILSARNMPKFIYDIILIGYDIIREAGGNK